MGVRLYMKYANKLNVSEIMSYFKFITFMTVIMLIIDVNAEKALEVTSSNPRDFTYKNIYDARIFLPTTMRRIDQNTEFLKIGKKKYWYMLDPAGLFSDQENRELNRIWYAENSCFSITPVNDSVAESEQYSIVPLIQKQVKAQIRIWSKTIKISTQYTDKYENISNNISAKKLLEMVSIWGYQWSLLGGEDLILYNGEIALAAYRRGFVFLYPQKWDYDLEKLYINAGKEI